MPPKKAAAKKGATKGKCAIIFLKHIKVKKRIINIDESWLDSGDYRRMSWQRKGTSNGIPVKKV